MFTVLSESPTTRSGVRARGEGTGRAYTITVLHIHLVHEEHPFLCIGSSSHLSSAQSQHPMEDSLAGVQFSSAETL